ncbi:phospholipid phosphatase-related protein type 2 isoform X1 [Crotalus tigris]|uniref:phospholipid phosphatase-related protein type 2 isoform X1 n=1 Tax=Crotalus tigris TaxID=88082 RepID=UPI00192F1607|nr:phospholipid phosphatase-related protein type 2 isoform X1 [Crotalus tigris]XP_039192414.1 phospholipid phosphatase-related protein type 2 isoform X1 [Crotalus tigris]XP_039192415.1 phospholipid phosphatase-related protein type 2 isoform X1 [Crotalus tigris]
MAGGKQELKRSLTIIPCFVFVELGIMAGTVVLAYHFEYSDTFPVHFQGFFCYDNTLAKPYPGPEDSSQAPPVLVYSLVTAVPTVTILIGELAAFFFQPTRHKEKTIISGECCYFNPLLRRTIRFLGVYSFGLFTTTIFANAGQVVTGNQTPHFLSVCQPNYTVLGCQPPPGTIYVTDKAACTGNPLLVTAACKAFPSKDAALSAYAVAYTVMYVTLVFQLKGSRLAKPSLCLALLGPAFLVGVVRVAEYRNHWSDVLAGFLTGGAIAIFLVTCVVNNFQSPISSAKKVSPPENLPSIPILGLPCVDSSLDKLSVAQGLKQVRDAPEEPEFSTLLSRGLERQLARSLQLAAAGSAAMTRPYEITELCSQRAPDSQLCLFPATPDVLIPSQSVTSEV